MISRARRRIYGKQVSISSFNTYIEMAAPLKGLIFDAVYGSWILSLFHYLLLIIIIDKENYVFSKKCIQN